MEHWERILPSCLTYLCIHSFTYCSLKCKIRSFRHAQNLKLGSVCIGKLSLCRFNYDTGTLFTQLSTASPLRIYHHFARAAEMQQNNFKNFEHFLPLRL